jgi:hypothetical protein
MIRKKIYFLSFFVLLTVFVCFCFNCFFREKKCISIPVVFGPANVPLAQTNIQGKTYLLEVDLGSKFPLTLRRDILKGLKKDICGNLDGRDVMGNSYTSPAYKLEKINIQGLEFKDVQTKEVHDDYVINTTLITEKLSESEILSENVGVIGRPLMEQRNLFLDFSHSRMIVCDKVSDIKKWGFSCEDFVLLPFDIGRTGIILVVDTDLGSLRLSVDTGSTLSLIRTGEIEFPLEQSEQFGLPYVTTEKFAMGGQDFGSMSLYLFDITEELHEIDGLLGMDFLKDHSIYIDYKNQLIYVGSTL